MKRFKTIKFRITIWYSVFIMILIGIALFLFCFASANEIKANVQAEVMQASHALARQHNEAVDENISDSGDFDRVSVYNQQGRYIAGRHIYAFDDIPFENEVVRRITVGGTEYIVYDYFKTIRDTGMWLRGATEVDFTHYFNNTLFKTMLLLLPMLFLLAIFGGFVIIRLAFRPVNRVITAAKNISAQKDLSMRIPIEENSTRDELYMMTVILNNMLDKIQKQFEREKRITLDISHELRTPISVILSHSEYLNELAANEKEKELAEQITEQTKKITRLISEILMLSRIENGRQTVHTEQIDVGNLIESVAEGMCDRAKQKQITIRTEFQNEIILPGDEALLMSAFVNLIDNAVKYGRQGGWINIKTRKPDGKAEILFEDNGIGIPDQKIDKIWDSFYQVDESHTNENEGYGLGLALVKSIIELHNGEVSVSSELGKGTIFKIIFKN